MAGTAASYNGLPVVLSQRGGTNEHKVSVVLQVCAASLDAARVGGGLRKQHANNFTA